MIARRNVAVRIIPVVAVLLLLFHVPDANADYHQPFEPLNGSFWIPRVLPDGTPPPRETVVVFRGELFTISTPCRTEGLAFRTTDSGIAFSNIGTYGSSCSRKPGNFDAIERAAEASKGFRLDGNHLVIHDGKGNTVVEMDRIVPAGLEYRTWKIESYFDGSKLAATPVEYRAFVSFYSGRLEGSPGCGALWGNYVLSGENRVRISAAWVLMGNCGPGAEAAIDRNDRVTNAMNGERWVELGEKKIVLKDAQGVSKIVLSAE